MVLQNHNTIAIHTLTSNATSASTTTITTNRQNTMDYQNGHPSSAIRTTIRNCQSNTNRSQTSEGMGSPRPLIDLLVAMIAIPVLILCALQLEKNLHEMVDSAESRWLVFALGIGMLIVSVIICGYVTHRMGVCMWAGPIDEHGQPTTHSTLATNSTHNSVNSSQVGNKFRLNQIYK